MTYYERHREERLAYQRAYHQKNRQKILDKRAQRREEKRAYMRRYYQENRKHLLAYQNRYNEEQRERLSPKPQKT